MNSISFLPSPPRTNERQQSWIKCLIWRPNFTLMSCSKNQMGEGTSREVASPTHKCRSLIQCPLCGQQQSWHFGLHLSVLVSAFQFPIWKTYIHDVAAITTRGPSCARVLWSHRFPVAPAVTSCSLRPRGPLRGKKSLADLQRATGWLKGVCVGGGVFGNLEVGGTVETQKMGKPLCLRREVAVEREARNSHPVWARRDVWKRVKPYSKILRGINSLHLEGNTLLWDMSVI